MAIEDRDEFLAAVGGGAHQHEDALPIFLQPKVEVHADDPDPAMQTNREWLSRMNGLPILATVPRVRVLPVLLVLVVFRVLPVLPLGDRQGGVPSARSGERDHVVEEDSGAGKRAGKRDWYDFAGSP